MVPWNQSRLIREVPLSVSQALRLTLRGINLWASLTLTSVMYRSCREAPGRSPRTSVFSVFGLSTPNRESRRADSNR